MGWNHPELMWNYPIVLYPLYHSGSRRFGLVEPPWTHSKLPCRPASSFITVVRGGSIGLPRTTLLIGEIGLQGSFKCVWGGSTTPNLLEQLWCMGKQAYMAVSSEFRVDYYTEPPLTTVMQGKAGLQGSFVWVFGGLTTTTSLNQQGSFERSGLFDHSEPPRTTLLIGEAGLQGGFEWVRGGSTTPKLHEPLWLEPLWCRGKQAYRAGSSEFWVVWPH